MNYHKRVYFSDVVDPDAPEGEKHLRAFIEAFPEGEDPEPETMEFIHDAFINILNGEDPKKALKLQTKQGVKSNLAKARRLTKEITIAVMIEEYLLQGITKDEARQKVAEKEGISWKTVKRCCTKKNELLAKEMIKRFQKHDEFAKLMYTKKQSVKTTKTLKPKKTYIEPRFCKYCGHDLYLLTTCRNCGNSQDKK